MNQDVVESYRLLAMSGVQGKKSEAIRVLCDEIDRLQKRNGFVAPAIEELKEYGNEIGLSVSDCEHFHDHYQANGWKVGRVRMIDWRAALRKWKRSPFRNGNSTVETKSIGQRYGVA